MSKTLLLREMSEITAKMAESARHGRWDEIVALEQQEAALAKGLSTASGSIQSAQEEKVLIQQILADHDEVRSYVDPWREQVEPLLKALIPQAT